MGDEWHDRAHEVAGGARYNWTQELVIEDLENAGSLVWLAWTRATMYVLLGRLAAVPDLDDKGVSPCSLSRTYGKLPRTEHDTAV